MGMGWLCDSVRVPPCRPTESRVVGKFFLGEAALQLVVGVGCAGAVPTARAAYKNARTKLNSASDRSPEHFVQRATPTPQDSLLPCPALLDRLLPTPSLPRLTIGGGMTQEAHLGGDVPVPAKDADADAAAVVTAGTGGGHNKLSLVPLIFLIFFEVAGGPYGAEPAVQSAGPLYALLGFLIFPFIWAIPEALVTAELSTAMPGNGGFVLWADRAFGPFSGSLMGTWKYVSGAINGAAFPALCADYLARVAPAVEGGAPRVATIVVFNVALSFLNYTGLTVVGWSAVGLGIASLSPFVLMSGIAIPKIRPHRWGGVAADKDWKLFFNTLFWNLNYWDSVSTMAGEVERPGKTLPKALVAAVSMTSLGYLLPLMAATGAVDVAPEAWGNGFFADAAGAFVRSFPSISTNQHLRRSLNRRPDYGLIAPPSILIAWLKYWIEVGAVLSSIGLYSATLSSAAFQLLGMADLGLLPRVFAARAPIFNTPWVSIVATSAITLGMSFFSFNNIVAAANFLYSLGMLLEFAAFIWLRVKRPDLSRPYRIPMRLPGAVALCLVPSAFLVFVMAIAGWKVYAISAAFTAAGVGVYYLMRFCKARGCLRFSDGDDERAAYQRQGSRNNEPAVPDVLTQHGKRAGVEDGCRDYLSRVVPAVSTGGGRLTTIVTFNVALTLLTYTGLGVVGWSAVALAIASLSPFFHGDIRPGRWGVAGGDKDWKLFLKTMFWNLNYWDSVSTMAGEVDRPGKTFPKALLSAVCMASLGYLLPLRAGIGATDTPPEAWGNGYFADAAGLIAGKWLKYWIEVGAVLSSIGLYSASLSSAAYLLAGMADLRHAVGKRRGDGRHCPGHVLLQRLRHHPSGMMLLEFAAFVRLRVGPPARHGPALPLPRADAHGGGRGHVRRAVYVTSAAITVTGVVVFYAMAFCKARGLVRFSRPDEEESSEEGSPSRWAGKGQLCPWF
ncbi:hypothetical protein HU200_018101 [Digitaria exilis]|uniref:Polyamine transporter n=1 Tax=Digitaria exilis TaxID=1010633 RepID=A0A835F5B4_9POAL|nr:hypothetical protein HU200_018101 [Digitaria exilis]